SCEQSFKSLIQTSRLKMLRNESPNTIYWLCRWLIRRATSWESLRSTTRWNYCCRRIGGNDCHDSSVRRGVDSDLTLLVMSDGEPPSGGTKSSGEGRRAPSFAAQRSPYAQRYPTQTFAGLPGDSWARDDYRQCR